MPGALDNLRKASFADALSWTEEDGAWKFVGGPGNRVVSPFVFPAFSLGRLSTCRNLTTSLFIFDGITERDTPVVQSHYDAYGSHYGPFL